MPVAIVMEFPGGTLEQYDQVIEKMGFEKGGPRRPRRPLPLGHSDR